MTYSYDLILQTLKLYYNKNYNIQSICKIFDISIKTFYNWRIKYAHIKIQLDTHKKTVIPIVDYCIKKSHKTKIEKKHGKYIIKQTINNQHFNCKELLFELRVKYKLFICKKTLYNFLSKMNITFKKARKKIVPNVSGLLEKKILLNKRIQEIKNRQQTIISIDESSFKLNMCQNYGWSIKGTKTNFIIDNTKSATYSVLCAIDKNKVIGKIIVKGSINSDIFISFLKKFIPKNKKCTLLLDNARIHKSCIFQQYIKTTKIELIYNIPYNPESNPIEHVFNKVKCIVRREPTNTVQLLEIAINKGFTSITKSNLYKFYNASFNTLSNNKIHDDKI